MTVDAMLMLCFVIYLVFAVYANLMVVCTLSVCYLFNAQYLFVVYVMSLMLCMSCWFYDVEMFVYCMWHNVSQANFPPICKINET